MSAKCIHGYWTHAFVKCPWCVGFSAATADVVPVIGRGNGWLLRKDQAPCISCGGPGNAGFGIIPSGISHEQWRAISAKLNFCYHCSLDGKVPAGIFDWRAAVDKLPKTPEPTLAQWIPTKPTQVDYMERF